MRTRPTILLFITLVVLLGYFLLAERTRNRSAPDPARFSLCDFDLDACEQILIQRSGESIRLRVQDTHWHMVEPVNDVADVVPVNTLLRSLLSARIERAFDDPDSLRVYGLSPARLIITVTGRGDTTLTRLEVGDFTLDKGYAYARRAGDDRVLLIPASIRHYGTLATEDFRFKKVAAFDLDVVSAYSMYTGIELLQWRRNGARWLADSAGETIEGDKQKVEEVLRRLRGLRVWSFPEEAQYQGAFSADDPWVEIERGAQGPAIRLTFARQDSTLALVRRDPDGRVVQTRVNTDDIFTHSLATMRDRHLMRFDPEEVVRLEVVTSDTTVTLVRRGGEWGPPNSNLSRIQASRVAALLGQMVSLQFEDYGAAPHDTSSAVFRVALLGGDANIIDEFKCFSGSDTTAIAIARNPGRWVVVDNRQLRALARRIRLLRN